MIKEILPPDNPKMFNWGSGMPNNEEIPKIIWLYWHSKELPDLVKMCISQFKKLLPDYTINIVSYNTLTSFLPNISKYREDLPIANYADLIRFELLYEYGGIWVDASTLLTENLDWAHQLKNSYHTDLIGFYSEHCTNDENFPVLETWFLATSPKNKFLEAWRNDFLNCYNSNTPEKYYEEIIKNPEFLQNIGSRYNYLLSYLSAMKIMRQSSDYKILMFKGEDTAHFYNFGANLSPLEVVKLFLESPLPSKVPKLIKFEKNRRILIENRLRIGKYESDAFLLKIVNEQNPLIKKIMRKYNYITFIFNNIKNKYIHQKA